MSFSIHPYHCWYTDKDIPNRYEVRGSFGEWLFTIDGSDDLSHQIAARGVPHDEAERLAAEVLEAPAVPSAIETIEGTGA